MSTPTPPSEWSECVQSLYEPIRSLGKGGFGSVWLARPKDENSPYSFAAIKVVHSPNSARNLTKVELGYAKREIAVLLEVSHANIVQLHSIIVEGTNGSTVMDIRKDSLTPEGVRTPEFIFKTLQSLQLNTVQKCCVVLSYHPGPTVQQLLDHGGALGYPLAKEIAMQLLHAVGFLHSRAVIHRDIKPDNLIISGAELNDSLCWSNSVDAEDAVRHNTWHLTLIDFGFARPLHPDDVHVDLGLLQLSNPLDSPSDIIHNKDLSLMSVDKPLDVNNTNHSHGSTSKDKQDARLERKESVSHHRVDDLSALGHRFFAAPEIFQTIHTFTQRLSTSGEKNLSKHSSNADGSSSGHHSIRRRSSLNSMMEFVSQVSLRRKKASKEHKLPLSEHVSMYGMVADAYSVGATLRYILTGCPPNVSTNQYIAQQTNPLNVLGQSMGSLFKHRSAKNTKKMDRIKGDNEEILSRKKQFRYQQDLPQEARNLILGLTHFDPQKRTSVRAALKNSWFGSEASTKENMEPVQFLNCVMEGHV